MLVDPALIVIERTKYLMGHEYTALNLELLTNSILNKRKDSDCSSVMK